jgi:hypothetical protein
MLRDFLDRFRPAGTPGAAGAVGVPADRLAGAEQELAPVFAALAGTERECAAIRERAERSAERRTAQAHRMAAAIIARARSQAAAERASAAAGVQEAARTGLEGISEAADRSAAAVRAAAAQRMPALVERVVHRALELAESAAEERP